MWDPNLEEVVFDPDGAKGAPLSRDQLLGWFNLPIEHPAHPAEVLAMMPWQDRIAIRSYCFANDLNDVWIAESKKWAGLVAIDATWHLDAYQMIHREGVDTFAIREFLITRSGERFLVLQDGRVVTFAEFNHTFGRPVTEHLTQHSQLVTEGLLRIAEHLTADVVEMEVSLQYANGMIGHETMQVLEGSTPVNWQLRNDVQVLAFTPLAISTSG